MKSTKTLRLGMAVLLILATLSQLFLSASADTFEDDYISYRSKVDAIDNSALRNTVQLHRLDQNYRKIAGMCNLCSMETLLNRRVAYDFGDYTSPFDDYDMFQAQGVSDLGGGMIEYASGKHGYYLSGGVGSAQWGDKRYPYNSSVTYKPVLLGNNDVTARINATGLSGLEAQYQAIATLLQEHPEGIWLRAEYGAHAIVITDYVSYGGRIQLYAIDPVNVRKGIGRMPIEQLYFYGNNYMNGMIGDISGGQYRINIAYLEQVGGSTATHPSASMSPLAPTEPAPTVSDRMPTLDISEQNAPSTLEVGGNFGIRGVIRTDCGIITAVYGTITDSYGTAVQSSTFYPNETEHNLRYSVNNELIFGRLPAGQYTYQIWAEAVNGTECTSTILVSANFEVVGPTNSNSSSSEPALNSVARNMMVNVGKGSTLRVCSTVSTADQYEIGSLPNGATVYVYGTTLQQYEGRTWAKISYNGTDGWVNYKWLY